MHTVASNLGHLEKICTWRRAITPQCQAEDTSLTQIMKGNHSTMSGGGCISLILEHATLLGCNKTFEAPKNRVSLGAQVNSYVHGQHYRQPQMTPLFGCHREKRTLKQFETNAANQIDHDLDILKGLP